MMHPGKPSTRRHFLTLAGGAVLGAADKLGLLRGVYSEPTTLGFNDDARRSPSAPDRGTSPGREMR